MNPEKKLNTMSIEKRGALFGLMTTVAMILFFFIMHLLGLSHHYHLRALNALFLFAGVYFAIRSHYKQLPPTNQKKRDRLSFIKEGAVGLMTTFSTATMFAVFVGLFLFLNNDFLTVIRENEPHGRFLTPPAISFLVFLEASVSGFIFTYIITQTYKEKSTENRTQETEKAEQVKGHVKGR